MNDIPNREEIDRTFEEFVALCQRLTAINEAEILRGATNERPQ